MSKDTCVMEPESQTYRLPRNVMPEKYEIRLTPDLNKFSFEGDEIIHLVCAKPTDEIVLNAIEITFEKAYVELADGTKLEAQVKLDEAAERATFKLSMPLPVGKCRLHIKFDGILNDKLHGFYRSKYKDDKGNEKVLASTQMEATDARRAFPCFDEPDMKAVFKITLIVDENLTAISNASVVSEKKIGSGKKEVEFADTIKMSTYLVAFIVGEFVGTAPVKAGKTKISIWAVPGKEHLSKFAEDIAISSVNFFSKYYEIDYPSDKMDLIAIPDFAFGAMENLGAITFRETALLVDEKTAAHHELERIADVVAHEIAHMWFGDLVTMKWWNGIWLNEAFATFAEMLAVDAWKPEWKRWDTFGVSRAQAFGTDGLASTRAIEFPVHSPDECNAMFDVLTYEKGGSVLRMLEQYLGADTFRKGVSLYLKKHEYANAETTDLWDGIEEASSQPVRKMMDSWIFQGGHPLLSVEADASGKTIEISQQRFFYQKEGKQEEQLFHVPVMIKAHTSAGPFQTKFILDGKSKKIELPGKVEWIVVNEGGHGFYRVRYSQDLLAKLTAIMHSKLLPIERFNLVNDTWASTLAGHTKLADYLSMAKLFVEETDKNVWTMLIATLNHLDTLIEDSARPALQAFTRKLLGSIIKHLGWEPKKGEDALTGQLRGMVIQTLGIIGNCPETQKQAKALYAKYKTDRSAVDGNVAGGIVSVVGFCGGNAEFDEFVKEFKAAKTPQEEHRFLFALALFQNEALVKKTLELSLTDEVRTQNAPYLVQSILGNTVGRNVSWKFFKENWKTMSTRFAHNAIPRMCGGVTNLVDPKLEKEVIAFFAENKVPQGGKTIDQHLEKLHVAVAFKEREKANFDKAFAW